MPATHFSPFATAAADHIDRTGEVALIRMIRQRLGSATLPSPQGIGDDCAVWPQPPQGEQLLFTTDAIVYGRHFDATCPPELAAAKLLKRNLSDIAAMGGTPHSALLALTLAPNASLEWLQHFIDGLRECALHYATPVTGGDITAGTDDFFAAHITLIGHAKRPLLRTGARAGDHLFVTGALGGSIHGHHLHFTPRLAEGRWLACQPDVRAMIDITDGLAKDLPELLHGCTGTPPSPPQLQAEAGTASPRANAPQAHTQTAANASQPAMVALLDLSALPVAAAAQSTPEIPQPAAKAAEASQPDSVSTPARPADTGTPTTPATIPAPTTTPAPASQNAGAAAISPQSVSGAIARALSDGEDYELLFAVDGATNPREFIQRWQSHFCPSQPAADTEALKQGTQSRLGAPSAEALVQQHAACPHHIGCIAVKQNHPSAACRLYDAASGQPLQLDKGGFEHL